jgi:ribosomal protein S18 acetylase RimI-like enzyme
VTPAGRVRVRPARPDDRDFVVATARRLSAFGPPRWRSADEVVDGEVRTLIDWFDRPRADAEVLVAEGADGDAGQRLGFVMMESPTDYFRRIPHGHVAILAVSAEAEGRGAAGALLRAADAWSRGRGFGWVTLNVFHGNAHARAVYEHAGYAPESLRYWKSLE